MAGFLKKDGKLYALSAKHIAGDVGQSCRTEDGYRLGEFVKVSKNLDLAVAQVDELNISRCDLALKDEQGDNLKIPCTVHNVPDDLQHLLVYIRGAESKPGLGKITIPFFQTMGSQHIIIENLCPVTSKNFCQNGDSGALVLGRARGNLKKMWVIGTVVGAYTSREEDETGKSTPGPQFLAVGLQAGLDDLSHDESSAFELATQNA